MGLSVIGTQACLLHDLFKKLVSHCKFCLNKCFIVLYFYLDAQKKSACHFLEYLDKAYNGNKWTDIWNYLYFNYHFSFVFL